MTVWNRRFLLLEHSFWKALSLLDHTFGANKVNQNNSYTTPMSGSYTYEYDNERRLKRVVKPSGEDIVNIYDKNRLDQVLTPFATIDYTYFTNGNVESISDGTETISYTYDGSLVKSETLSGNLG